VLVKKTYVKAEKVKFVMRLMDLLRRINLLKSVPRTGWALAKIERTSMEDVAQHSFEVASICVAVGDELKKRGTQLDLHKTVLMALIHDWNEALIGDIPYPALEYAGDRGFKSEMEVNATAKMLSGHPELLALWQEYHEQSSPEARLVRAADYLSMLLQALTYMERGTRCKEMDGLWAAVRQDITPFLSEFPLLSGLVDELEQKKAEILSSGG